VWFAFCAFLQKWDCAAAGVEQLGSFLLKGNQNPHPVAKGATRVGHPLCEVPLLGGGLLLIGWDEGIGYESFVTGWGGVLGCAGFEGAHVSGVEGADHFQEQAGEGLGHSHLH